MKLSVFAKQGAADQLEAGMDLLVVAEGMAPEQPLQQEQHAPAEGMAELKEHEQQIIKEFNIDNCRVCIDVKEWQRKAQRMAFTTGKPGAAASATGLATASAAAATDPRPLESPSPPPECPPDRAELGRATWTFLHTMAAYYPEHPTAGQQEQMSRFIHAFSEFYPCASCASHLRQELGKNPPQAGSRHELSRWFCRLHNKVSKHLGKPAFDCDRLDERWRHGPADGSCDD